MKKEELIKILNEKQKEYDYSLIDDEFTYSMKLPIICNKKDINGNPHGIFYTTIGKIKRGDGCPCCSGRHMTKEEFVQKSNILHNNIYDYSKFNFINKKTKGVIICKKHNIEFEQTPTKHLLGQGCPKCRYEKSAKSKTLTNEEFIKRAQKIHNNKYDYSKCLYKKTDEKVEIICPEHGSFYIMPTNHCHKTLPQGCPKCGREKTILGKKLTLEEFVQRANERHNNKYIYDNVILINTNTKVDIICPQHGIFSQEPDNHLNGQGCPHCSKSISKAENELCHFIKEKCNCIVQQRNRDIIHPYEIDIFIKDKNIGIEYNGLIWHSEKFTKKTALIDKTKLCKERGIRLIHIFEDEWLYKQNIVKSMVSNLIGATNNKIYARKCEIKSVDSKECKNFLDENHIQGATISQINYGLYYNNELVSLMAFGRLRQKQKEDKNYEKEYELLRFCNKLNTNVIGGASKLLKHFIKTNKPHQIITYADKRWSVGDLYYKLGFTYTHDSVPNYFYIINGKRKNRFSFRKKELIRKYNCPQEMTEHEFCLNKKWYRIYDCGTMCFKMTLQ